MSLLYIGEQLTIYCGLLLLMLGVVGNGINVLVFSSVRNYRTTPCTFYFLISSIYNIAYITIALISRIVATGFGMDLTRTSTSWCKIRPFFLPVLSLISLSCSCLATIDQFFVTSQNANLRRFSNIKWSHRIVIIVMIIWFLHGIPFLLFYNISPITATCVITNIIFDVYFTIYLLVPLCVVPVSVTILFGYLAYRNIHLTRALAEQQADRQLLRMALIQVVLIFISAVPFGINNIYSLITSGVNKDANRLMNESFALTIFILLSYFYYAVCLLFYVR